MLNVSDELRLILRNDSIPSVESISHKELRLVFTDGSTTITVNNDQIVDDSFKLTETLCSTTDLTYGGGESSQLKVTVADVGAEIKGMSLVATLIVENTHEIPLGVFIVDSAKKQADLRFKDVVAYDYMAKFDIDVAGWYNSLTFPMSLLQFRKSLCDYVGVGYEAQTLTNDNMVVNKTISPTTLIGRDVVKRIGEINGSFSHMSRYGKQKFTELTSFALYPSETLYPSESLFPNDNNEFVGSGGYKDSTYEEYIVNPINKLIMREDDEDLGVTVGDGTNAYVIKGNFLIYGLSTSQKTTISNNIYLKIANKPYRPHTTNLVGLPYMEVGDTVSVMTSDDTIETFVFQRVLSGIQALNDEYVATGNETREQDTSLSTKITQLQSKTAKIVQSVDELSSTLTDTAEGLESQITQTASSLTSTISNLEDSLTSEIEQTESSLTSTIKSTKDSLQTQISQNEERISLKVSTGNVSSELSLESGKVTLSSNRLVVDSTNFKLDGSGNATFSGNVKGATITGGTLTQTLNGNNTVEIDANGVYVEQNAEIHVGQYSTGYTVIDKNGISITGSSGGGVSFTKDGAYFTKLNGNTPITTDNIGSYAPTDTYGLDANLSSSSYGSDLIRFKNTSGTSQGATASYVQSYVGAQSDERLKENIQEIDDITSKYMQLNPIEYDWKLKNGHDYGLSAQKLYEICPDMVRVNTLMSEEEKELCNDGIWEIKYNNLHAYHVKMIQRHEQIIERQEQTIQDLLRRVEALEKGGSR